MSKLPISASMLRRLSLGAFALVLVLFLASVIPVWGDTGTYQISNYKVTLEPQSSGQVNITVSQDWKVLSGDIPWVTVGLPNDNYTVQSHSQAAARVSAANSTGFSGVRIDLDKDYLPGQTFTIQFTVLQDNLLERLTADKKWRINYTPGWYDKAAISHLQIDLISPVNYQTYSALSPAPASVAGSVITWESLNLPPGSKFNLNIESTDGNFLSATVPLASTQNKAFGSTFFIIIGIILILGLLIFWALRKNRQARDAELKNRIATVEEELAKDKDKRQEAEQGFEKYVEDKKIQTDQQGRYYDRGYGNYITPAIWAAVISNQYNRQQNQSGSVPPSCACACVSCACACACACAGGGAAGCSRKTLHQCRTCAIKPGKP